jgi:hypothetical protein
MAAAALGGTALIGATKEGRKHGKMWNEAAVLAIGPPAMRGGILLLTATLKTSRPLGWPHPKSLPG